MSYLNKFNYNSPYDLGYQLEILTMAIFNNCVISTANVYEVIDAAFQAFILQKKLPEELLLHYRFFTHMCKIEHTQIFFYQQHLSDCQKILGSLPQPDFWFVNLKRKVTNCSITGKTNSKFDMDAIIFWE